MTGNSIGGAQLFYMFPLQISVTGITVVTLKDLYYAQISLSG